MSLDAINRFKAMSKTETFINFSSRLLKRKIIVITKHNSHYVSRKTVDKNNISTL